MFIYYPQNAKHLLPFFFITTVRLVKDVYAKPGCSHVSAAVYRFPSQQAERKKKNMNN